MHDVCGVILAGGLSRRMEGTEKSLLPVCGIPLIQRVKTRLADQVSPILLNANGDGSRFSFLDLPIQPDPLEGFAGPLAGVLAGMKWAEGSFEWIITAAADTPFFPKDYASKMVELRGENKIILAASNQRRHPVFSLWHVSLAENLESFLVRGDRKVMLFVQEYANQTVNFEFDKFDPFFNVNTPSDLEQAELIAKEIDG